MKSSSAASALYLSTPRRQLPRTESFVGALIENLLLASSQSMGTSFSTATHAGDSYIPPEERREIILNILKSAIRLSDDAKKLLDDTS